VLHLGDITDDNLPEQWENAAAAMKRLDGKVPYFMAPGNHDYSKGGTGADRTSLFSEYFPVASFQKLATTGGFYDKEPNRVENSYHFFKAGGRRFLVLCLEFGPRRDVVRWANEIVAKHADCEAILVTHVYTYHDSTRYDFKKFGKKQSWSPHVYGMATASKGDVSDGQELWDGLVSRHPNFIFTINGHVLGDGLGRLVTATPQGREVPQMLVNFQMKPNGGDGWLRLLEMRPDGSLLSYDYSPTRNQTNAGKENQFQVKVRPVGRV
jgi:3',5'-cyclic AMP phosphodiesterase CpdA